MNASKISKAYLNFVKENTKFNDINETHTEVITPYVDPFGEGITFSVNFDGTFYTVTDDGDTIWNLELYGINVNKKGNRQNLLKSLADFNSFNIKDKTLSKTVSKKDLGQSIHDMTQLLLDVYNFSQLHPQNVASQFLEDVNNFFFIQHKNRFNVFPEFSISGKSQLSHRFNFVFLGSENSKLAKVYNSIDKQQVDSILASWLDTVEYRKRTYKDSEKLFIIVSSDGYNKLKQDHILALKEYDINVLNFADHDNLIKQLGKTA